MAWIITSDTYGDYRVHGVAPSREVAEQIVAQLNTLDPLDDYYAEEVPDVSGVEDIRRASAPAPVR